MCHPTGSGASSIFFSGSFFVFLFLLSSVPPRAQADLPTKPTGNGLSSMPTNSAREEARELHHISAVELAWLVLHALEVHSLELHSLEVHSLEAHSLDVHSLFAMGMSGGACPGLWQSVRRLHQNHPAANNYSEPLWRLKQVVNRAL